ncbi:VOC family protein [Ensifer sp. LCM 4579]|uniref:VOC family protein n=1 Tax=Ensifer sp. LCM 4579 TaxID=1848292 RepID=UPI000ABC0F84|nr:VOC family protein [Ensifer sp. LCM 4579]
MRLNQVTVTMADLDAGWQFYGALGLKPIVDARSHYARFVCPDGDSTFSLHPCANGGGGTTIYFECENLDETVGKLEEAGLRFVSGAQYRLFAHVRGVERIFPEPASLLAPLPDRDR